MLGSGEGAVLLLTEGIHLEDGVEVHQLQAVYLIQVALRLFVLEIVVHCGECAWVAVGHWCAEQFVVVAHEHEVYSPRVDAHALYLDTSACHLGQCAQYLAVEREDIPVGVMGGGDESVGEASYLFGL